MSDIRDPERDQVAPVHNDGPSCHDLVIEDMRERKEHGLNKYKTILQPFNGRSFLQDAYEEVLDLAAYLRGKLEEERVLTRTEGNVEDPEVISTDAAVAALQAWAKTVYPSLRDSLLKELDDEMDVILNGEGRTACVNHADRAANYVVWPSGSDRGYPSCRECFELYEAHEAPIRTRHLFRKDDGNPVCTHINGDPVEVLETIYAWGSTDIIQPCQMCTNVFHIWQTDLRDETKAQCTHVATELKLIPESAGYVKGFNREHWARICKQCDETIKRYDTL